MKRYLCQNLDDIDAPAREIRALIDAGKTASVTVGEGKEDRTAAQNRLAFLWYSHLAETMQDGTANDKRAICKLHVGVPIRREDEAFREKYDRIIRPLTYEQKLEIMVEPIDFPVTRDMSVKEMTRYLEGVEKMWAEQGVILPRPEDTYYSAMGVKRK